MRPQRITKIERFIEALLLSRTDGSNPQQLGLTLATNNVPRLAQNLRAKGVKMHTTPTYSIVSQHDAEVALKLLNQYRRNRGAHKLPEELISGWEI